MDASDFVDAVMRNAERVADPPLMTKIVKLHEPTFGEEEIAACVEVLRSTVVTSGEKVREFEERFEPGGHAVMCNSGSSANLLAVAALCNPTRQGHLAPGDEVIVSALSWSTTVFPLIQYGLVPVIVDINPDTLNMDPERVEAALGPRTKAIMPVHVYGNPCEMTPLMQIANRVGLFVIEDCCEALGARYGHRSVGSFGQLSTFSFYYSHHITTMEGGIVVVNNTDLEDTIRSLRSHGWTREMTDYVPDDPTIDPRFTFATIGYNLRATELQAAMGLVQLPKLAVFVEARRAAASKLEAAFTPYYDRLWTQLETLGGRSSWFGFSVIVRFDAPFTATDLRAHFERNGIETRAIICGNIARQPAMRTVWHRVPDDLKNADDVMQHGFSIGCHQDVGENECDYIRETLDLFMKA